MPAPQRVRTLDEPCPRCGAPLQAQEVGLMSAEDPEPLDWSMVRRWCSRGCLLTASDFEG